MNDRSTIRDICRAIRTFYVAIFKVFMPDVSYLVLFWIIILPLRVNCSESVNLRVDSENLTMVVSGIYHHFIQKILHRPLIYKSRKMVGFKKENHVMFYFMWHLQEAINHTSSTKNFEKTIKK